jgi:hypothetical protein
MIPNLLSRKFLSPPFLAMLLALCVLSYRAIGQSAQTQTKPSSHPEPVSLPHLYWHFLVYQNFLDNKAAGLAAQGKNGELMRNDLQSRLKFSDVDYAPIRTSSQRLASEIKALDEQAKEIHGSGSSSYSGQMSGLAAQREADINNEIYNLTRELSPQNKAALDAFLVQFFAPKNLVIKPSLPATQLAGKAVLQ